MLLQFWNLFDFLFFFFFFGLGELFTFTLVNLFLAEAVLFPQVMIVTIIKMKNIMSLHDIKRYASFILGVDSIEAMTSFLLVVQNSNRNISNQVPWHVTDIVM